VLQETPEGNKQKTEDEKKQEALEFFKQRLQAMDLARQPYYNRFEKDEKLFRSHLETADKADWQSKYFIPRTYGLVMSSLAEFAINKPDIWVEPDTRKEATKVPYMRAALHANWRRNKGNAELLYVLLDAIKLGIGFYEIGYKKIKRKIKDISDYNTETEEIKWKEKEIYDFDDVFFEAVNPRYLWFDESASTIADASDCIRKYIYNEQVFHQIFDSKFPEATNIRNAGVIQKEEFYKPFIGEGTGTNEICVYKYNNKIKDVIWWIANGTLLNKVDDPIPFHHKQLPYAEVKIAPFDKYTFYGMSLPRLVEDIQHELNTLRNMAIDQTHLNIFSPFFYGADEDIDESVFTIEPGIGIPVNDPHSFNFFKQGAVGADAYNLMDRFDDDSRQATGFSPTMQALPSGGTATETTILKETSLKRINLYLRFLEDINMPDFARLWGDTIQQFYFSSSEVKKRKRGEKTEVFRSIKIPKADMSSFGGGSVEIAGEFNFLTVTANDIRGDFDFNIKIGTSISISKELDKQVKLQLYSILGADDMIKREKLIIDVLKAHDRDPEEYMTTSQQVDIEQSIALAEEQNKMLIAGEEPRIIPELVTPEHIQLHDALIKSPNVDREIKKRVMAHVMDEMRVSKVGAIPPQGGSMGGEEFPAAETTPELAKPLTRSPGLPRETTHPFTASEVGAGAPGRSVVKPR